MACRTPPNTQSINNRILRAAAAGLLAAAMLSLAACEQEEAKPPPQPPPEQAVLSPVGFEDLPGWNTDRHAEVVPALLRSCARFLKQPPGTALGARIPGASAADIQPACRAAQSLPVGHDLAARSFFEQWFQPWAVKLSFRAR
jgi:membrane-bound lytic murein transglycosylase A